VAPQPVWALWRRGKLLTCAGILSPDEYDILCVRLQVRSQRIVLRAIYILCVSIFETCKKIFYLLHCKLDTILWDGSLVQLQGVSEGI
jgi:hypothetical protein